MKYCRYCGRENGDEAVRCQYCGIEFGREREPGAPESWENIVTLDNKVQAGLADAILSERKIPHIMQTYHDSAYDGMFPVQKGWGIILAPPDFRAEILAVVEDVKRQSSSSATTRQNPDHGSR